MDHARPERAGVVRIPNGEIPADAVAVLPAEMRRCDTLNLVAEQRLWCRSLDPRQAFTDRFIAAPEFEYRFVGGSVGWRDVVPGYMAEFFVAGLVERTRELRPGDWSKITLTQAGEFLFSVWYRDRDRRRAAGL